MCVYCVCSVHVYMGYVNMYACSVCSMYMYVYSMCGICIMCIYICGVCSMYMYACVCGVCVQAYSSTHNKTVFPIKS